MKKKYLFVIITFISLCIALSVGAIATDWFSFESQSLFDLIKSSVDKTDSDILVTVNGEKIYRQSVEIELKGKEMSAQSLINTEYYEEPVDKESLAEEIIQKKIRNIVVRQEAEKKGLKADYEAAKRDAVESYNMVKEANDENYLLLLEYMELMDYTEEEYLELLVENYIEMYTRANLYDWFVEGKEANYDELVAEYEKYVQSLIDKADVVYKQ